MNQLASSSVGLQMQFRKHRKLTWILSGIAFFLIANVATATQSRTHWRASEGSTARFCKAGSCVEAPLLASLITESDSTHGLSSGVFTVLPSPHAPRGEFPASFEMKPQERRGRPDVIFSDLVFSSEAERRGLRVHLDREIGARGRGVIRMTLPEESGGGHVRIRMRNVRFTPVPEPSALLFMGMGLAGLATLRSERSDRSGRSS